MGLCVLAAGKLTMFAVASFSLTWTHTVEKTTWREEWVVAETGLRPVSAIVEGSGAGMDVPDGAVSVTMPDGRPGWRFTPKIPAQMRVLLADSGKGGRWRLCGGQECMDLGNGKGRPIALEVCP